MNLLEEIADIERRAVAVRAQIGVRTPPDADPPVLLKQLQGDGALLRLYQANQQIGLTAVHAEWLWTQLGRVLGK